MSDGEGLAILSEVRRALNADVLPQFAILSEADELAGPITIGIFRPLVVLPVRLRPKMMPFMVWPPGRDSCT